MKKVLVTGGTGMIGRYLVPKLLTKSNKVFIASLDGKELCPKGAIFKKLDFGKDMAEAEAKAWKTIWSAGHGVSSIDDNPACKDLIDKLKAEFIDSIESQKTNLNFGENNY